MKTVTLFTLFLLALFLPALAIAQIGDYQLSKVTVNHGRGALSSGLDVAVKFSDDSKSVTLQANADRFNGAHQWDFGTVALAATGGVNKNTPWFGPRMTVDWTSNLSTLHWFGAFTGEIGELELDPKFFFSYHSLALTVGQLELGSAWIHYRQDLPRLTPWVNYTQRLNSSFELSPTVTWDVRKEELLYQVGLIWKPLRK